MIERPEHRPRRVSDGNATPPDKRLVQKSGWREDLELAWETFDSYLRAGAIAFIALQSTATLSRVPQIISERALQAELSGGELPYCDEKGLRRGAYCRTNWDKTGPVQLYHWLRDGGGNLYADVKAKDGHIGVIRFEPATEQEIVKKLLSREREKKNPATERQLLTPDDDVDTLADHAKNRKRLGR